MKIEIKSFLTDLREKIIASFEEIEKETFVRQKWDYKHEGGGEIALLRANHFEKAAVNWSQVSGPNFPGSDEEKSFCAMGVSLITHMHNPHAPTVHFNLRYIETENNWWFGGGFDLTPMGIWHKADIDFFHQTAKDGLKHFPGKYEEFFENAKNYFFIPHRGKERGAGGLFFDNLNSGDFCADFSLLKTIGQNFLPAILPIYHSRIFNSFTEAEKNLQLQQRAHYVEFNLMYDRGTKFGFQSGGNPEAILCSLPPLVKW